MIEKKRGLNKVIAIEPHPRLVESLRANIEYRRDRWKDHHCDIQQAVEFISIYDYRICFVKHDLVFPFETAVPDSCDLFCSQKINKFQI